MAALDLQMNILTYFEKGPGTNTIKELAIELVTTVAQRVGVNPANIDKVAIAYPENYEKAVQDLTGGSCTNNEIYTGVGKAFSTEINGKINHSIVLHSCIFEAIFSNSFPSPELDFSQWEVEAQCLYFVVPHELGHCRDYENRLVPHQEKKLISTNRFDLESVHQYYSEILIGEVFACYYGDKYYSQKMIDYRHTQERKTLNEGYDNLRQGLQAYSGNNEELFPLAMQSSGWLWVYLIQMSKHIISSFNKIPQNEHITPLTDIFENCVSGHMLLLEALNILISNYPIIPEQAHRKLVLAWNSFAGKTGLSFNKHNEIWEFYWN
jgi:hypothetical protein